METLKKLGRFIFAFAWMVNAIGGSAYHFYRGDAVFGVLNILMSAALFPEIVDIIKELIYG